MNIKYYIALGIFYLIMSENVFTSSGDVYVLWENNTKNKNITVVSETKLPMVKIKNILKLYREPITWQIKDNTRSVTDIEVTNIGVKKTKQYMRKKSQLALPEMEIRARSSKPRMKFNEINLNLERSDLPLPNNFLDPTQ